MNKSARELGITRRIVSAAGLAALAPALLLLVAAATSAPADAATVSGVVKNGTGLRVLAVQANGKTKTTTITKKSGAFSISGVKLRNATLQLVNADGSFFGPIVLKSTATKAYTFIKGARSLKIGRTTLRSGYALVCTPRAGRYQTLAGYTAKAVKGKPTGARKLGLVRTVKPQGYNGPGGDLDLDGVINAFDIDDNGNRIIDNVDRTGRGSGRPGAGASRAAFAACSSEYALGRDESPAPVPAPTATEFRMFSNYKLRAESAINVNVPGITDIGGLIASYVPTTVTLATQVIGGDRALLDGLGNAYLLPHTVGGMTRTYPRMNWSEATYTDGVLELVKEGADAQIMPGALPEEIGSGDCFVETAQDGSKYPGTLNYVFNTASALKSYQFNTQATATEVVYDEKGVLVGNEGRLTAPLGATSVTLTFWRPQRKATPAEAAAGEWVDIGGLMYIVQIIGPTSPSNPIPGGNAPQSAYSNASANGAPITLTPENEGVLDTAADAPSNPANTITFTLDLTKCYPDGALGMIGAGEVLDIDLMAQSAYGDNAARGLFFELQ